ncbi:hypothetical protein [Flavobacterium microcysteis]|uniref:Uncharacterized protein n=1 Tax=Flavobacterium microcysteis TaxID=2596891 RepID=A0A501Q3U6_9FLAO|nr:hypothetical protein [Flavobacterium microcysteis]TPD66994.1 hypothetical protein FJA49_11985 [Flavobacterium microcysteis]
MEEQKHTHCLLEKLKQKAKEQKFYGNDYVEEPAKLNSRTCTNCGAGRAKEDGLTHCAYCGFEFLSIQLTDGIHLKKEDNSRP